MEQDEREEFMGVHALLDVVIVVGLLVHVRRGWRSGGLASVFAMAGAVGGGLLGLWAIPLTLQRWVHGPSAWTLGHPGGAFIVLAGTILAATLGECLLGPVGLQLRARTQASRLRRLDDLVGALAQGLAFSIVVAVLAVAVKPALPTSWGAALNGSRVLPAFAEVTPDTAHRWTSQVTKRLDVAGFPQVFSGLQHEPVIASAAPDDSAKGTAAVRRAAASIVKVTTHSDSCSRSAEGSGWVVAAHRVVTNAHVVAGASSTRVQVTGRGRLLDATVVAFDPRLDLAILDVPSLTAPALHRSGPLAAQQGGVVAGFPLDGSYTLRAARVRGVVRAVGDDIYGNSGTSREVYSINADVRPGNSGGPLLTQRGTVAGTVFARSTVIPSTGYVLTDQATDAMLDRASSYRHATSTQSCAAD